MSSCAKHARGRGRGMAGATKIEAAAMLEFRLSWRPHGPINGEKSRGKVAAREKLAAAAPSKLSSCNDNAPALFHGGLASSKKRRK